VDVNNKTQIRLHRKALLPLAVSSVVALTCSTISQAQIFPDVFDLNGLDGSTGFSINDADEQDEAGFSVRAAGDVNGDGIPDLIAGAPFADFNGDDSGSAYVIFGRDSVQSGDFPAGLDFSALDGSSGFRLDGSAAGDNAGYSVSDIGDINGDGVDDIAIGAINADPTFGNDGSVYVVFGRDTALDGIFPAVISLSALDGSDGFRLDGAQFYDRIGVALSRAGDINGDGLEDMAVGAPGADQGDLGTALDSGESYVVFGRNTSQDGNFPSVLSVASLDGSIGFRLDGLADFDTSGAAIDGAGDINGDGFDDLMIGAPGVDHTGGQTNAGSVYVVFGRDAQIDGDFAAVISLSGLDGNNGFVMQGAAGFRRSGASVSFAGDINGDGIDDVVLGSPGAGESEVLFGRNTAISGNFQPTLDLGSLDGNTGFIASGNASGNAGVAVSGAGDLNGDGISDVMIGADLSDLGAQDSGSSFVVFGRQVSITGDFAQVVGLNSLDGCDGFRLDSTIASDQSGAALSSIGDLNNDGFDDVVIGAPGMPDAPDSSAASYVVFGREEKPGPGLTANPDNLDFGNPEPGSATVDEMLIVQNPGACPITIESLSLQGAASAEFAIHADNCSGQTLGTEMGVDDACSVEISFNPSTAGLRIAELNVPFTSQPGLLIVELSGFVDGLFEDGFELN